MIIDTMMILILILLCLLCFTSGFYYGTEYRKRICSDWMIAQKDDGEENDWHTNQGHKHILITVIE